MVKGEKISERNSKEKSYFKKKLFQNENNE